MRTPQPLILHVITGLGSGGAEAMLAKLISGTEHFRHDVLSLTDGGALGDQIEVLGAGVDSLNLRSPAGLFTALPRLRARIRRTRPSLIQGWLTHGNFAATIARIVAGSEARLLWNVRQSLVDMRLEKWMTRRVLALDARLSHLPDLILYNSKVGADQHEAIGFAPEKRQLVPNGFDLERFSPCESRRAAVRQGLGIEPNEILIGLVARFHKMKNHAGFLRAAEYVLDAEPNARFMLVGAGLTDDNAGIASLMSRRVRQRTLLLGSRIDVPDLTRAMDIACNVSVHGEGFPNTIGEAMASGVPCVVTAAGDLPDIVGDTGIVARTADPGDIASSLVAMIARGGDGRAELGRAARARVAAHYSLPAIVARYEAIYQTLLTDAVIVGPGE